MKSDKEHPVALLEHIWWVFTGQSELLEVKLLRGGVELKVPISKLAEYEVYSDNKVTELEQTTETLKLLLFYKLLKTPVH